MKILPHRIRRFLCNASSVIGILLVASLTLGTPAAKADVWPWHVCTAPNITPGSECTGLVATEWLYSTPGIGSSNSMSGLVSMVQSFYLANPTTCSFTLTSTELNYPGIWGPEPILYLSGIDYFHQHKLTFQQSNDPPLCNNTFDHVVWIAQQRTVTCPIGFEGATGSNPAYCARPWPLPDPAKCPSCSAGDVSAMTPGNPIDVSGGNKRQSERDYRGSGSSPLSFTRHYHSLFSWLNSPDPNAPAFVAGQAWTADYFQKVSYVTLGALNTAYVFRPNSQRLIFHEVSGAFVGPADALGMRLAAQRDGSGTIIGWTLTLPSDTVETYDAAGKLLSIVERGGIAQTLAYDGNGKLSTVTDSFGHQCSLLSLAIASRASPSPVAG